MRGAFGRGRGDGLLQPTPDLHLTKAQRDATLDATKDLVQGRQGQGRGVQREARTRETFTDLVDFAFTPTHGHGEETRDNPGLHGAVRLDARASATRRCGAGSWAATTPRS